MSDEKRVQPVSARYTLIALVISIIINIVLFLYLKSTDENRTRLTFLLIAGIAGVLVYVWIRADAAKIDYIKICEKKVLPKARALKSWRGTMKDVTMYDFGNEVFYQLHSPGDKPWTYAYNLEKKTVSKIDDQVFDKIISGIEKSEINKAIKLESEVTRQKKKQLKSMGLEEKEDDDE